jgi:FAD/FMN-containing dehydrogenase
MSDAPDQLAVELSTFYLEQPVIAALVCWCGPLDEGERVVARVRSFGAPVFDHVRSVAFAHLADQSGGAPPNLYWQGASLDALTDAAADALEAQVRAAPAGWSIGLGHVMHGAVVRVARGETPFVRSPGRMAYFLGAGWMDASGGGKEMAWVDSAMAAMAPWSSSATYVNYLSDDRPAAVEAAYGSNYERLRAIKRRYDPDNVFRHNRNIRP